MNSIEITPTSVTITADSIGEIVVAEPQWLIDEIAEMVDEIANEPTSDWDKCSEIIALAIDRAAAYRRLFHCVICGRKTADTSGGKFCSNCRPR